MMLPSVALVRCCNPFDQRRLGFYTSRAARMGHVPSGYPLAWATCGVALRGRRAARRHGVRRGEMARRGDLRRRRHLPVTGKDWCCAAAPPIGPLMYYPARGCSRDIRVAPSNDVRCRLGLMIKVIAVGVMNIWSARRWLWSSRG